MQKKLLLLDLDLTLIFAWGYEPEWGFDFILNGYWVKKRPHLDEFLNYSFNNFNVGIYTGKNEKQAHDTVEKLGIKKSKLVCLKSGEGLETNYRCEWPTPIKDLSFTKRKGYDLSDVLIVDDNKDGLARNPDNLIKIEPFYTDSSDREFVKLMKYLDTIKNAPDVRTIDKTEWDRSI